MNKVRVPRVKVVNNKGAVKRLPTGKRGLTVGALQQFLADLPEDAKNTVVCIGLEDTVTPESRIVGVVFNSDDAVTWLHLDRRFQAEIDDRLKNVPHAVVVKTIDKAIALLETLL